MKIIIFLGFVFAVAAAEPPRYRSARFRPEKESESVPASRRSDDAPYPSAGFRPPTEFVLPARQEVVPPATSYGVPADSYGTPFLTYLVPRNLDTEYGPPTRKAEGSEGGEGEKEGEEKEGESKDGEEKEGGEGKGEAEDLKGGENEEGGENREKGVGENEEGKDGGEKGGEENKRPEVITTGAYYILLPDSQLQRVQFRTENDFANMAYTARLQYRNEDRAPIYVYTPVPLPQYGAPPSASYVQWSY